MVLCYRCRSNNRQSIQHVRRCSSEIYILEISGCEAVDRTTPVRKTTNTMRTGEEATDRFKMSLCTGQISTIAMAIDRKQEETTRSTNSVIPSSLLIKIMRIKEDIMVL